MVATPNFCSGKTWAGKVVVVLESSTSEVEGIAVDSFTGSSEKKNELGVGERIKFSDCRFAGLITSGLIFSVVGWFLAYQERTPTTEKRIIIRGKNLSVFCFMGGSITVKALVVKL